MSEQEQVGIPPSKLDEYPLGAENIDKTIPPQEDTFLRRPSTLQEYVRSLSGGVAGEQRNATTAYNEVYDSAVITGERYDLNDRFESAKVRTVEDEALDILISDYQDNVFMLNTLQTIGELPREKQIEVLNRELTRRDMQKISAKEALLIQVMLAGRTDMTMPQFEQLRRSFTPSEVDQFRVKLKEDATERLRQVANEYVARMDIANGSNPAVQVLQQDFIPIANVFTRREIAVAQAEAIDMELGWFESLWPGSIRKKIREYIAESPPAEREEMFREMGQALEQLKDGEYGAYFTEYGILEAYAGTFTDALMEENISKDTLDTFMGNLDVLLELVYGAGIIAKTGGRTFRSMSHVNDTLNARRVARVTGNHKLRKKLEEEMDIVMAKTGEDTANAAATHMPTVPSLAGDRQALPGPLQAIISRGERIEARVLDSTDDITGIGLTVGDKAEVIRRELSELDSMDTIQVNPGMGVLEELPNGTGFKYRAVYTNGEDPFRTIDEALENAAAELDPSLENVKILMKNDLGNLEEIPREMWPAYARGTKVGRGELSDLADDELIALSKQVDPNSPRFAELEAEAARRAQGDREFIGSGLNSGAAEDGEFYLEMDYERYWHVADKQVLGVGTWRGVAGKAKDFLRSIAPPNFRFGDEMFQSFDRPYRIEQQNIRRLEQIYQPYYALSRSDRAMVEGVFEWMEKFAQAEGRAPELTDLLTKFDDLTTKQVGGILSLQQGLNTQFKLFNRRYYRELHTKGAKTARSNTGDLPEYHGVIEPKEQISGQQVLYDPATQTQVRMSADDVKDLYDSGGGVMKIDISITVPGTNGAKKASRILIKPEDYEIGALSTRVLDYTPGYFPRFYKDPYHIIKKSRKEVDGRVGEEVEEALRTAGSIEEAERALRRLRGIEFDPKRGLWFRQSNPDVTYRVERAADLKQNESSLFTKSELALEGRMFWDKRNHVRMRNVNGNKADVLDPVVALERGTVQAIRQTTHEDLMKSYKKALGTEFKDILSPTFPTESINETISYLRTTRINATNEATKLRYDKALEIAKYIRLQQGTDEWFVPTLREGAVQVAAAIGRIAGRHKMLNVNDAGFKLSRVLENYAQTMDPLRSMRSVAFHVFMVTRPFRQRLLQGMQFMFLAPLDPAYMYSGKVLMDGHVLKSELMKLQRAGYDDGIKMSRKTQLTGYSKKEWKTLVNEADRSGLFDTVDVNAFAGGALRPKHKGGGVTNTTLAPYRWLAQKMQKHGFDAGEQSNLMMTYMLAVRRHLKRRKFKSIREFDKADWDDIGTEAMNLALAMTKPNKMWFQSGAAGNMTQFLSFGYKASAALVGGNPAIRGADVAKILIGNHLMWGANMWGLQEYARDWLAFHGIDRWAEEQIPGYGGTLLELIHMGLMEKAFNTIIQAHFEADRDMDLGWLAPGANVRSVWQSVLEGFVESFPSGFFGPFGTPASGAFQGADFIARMWDAKTLPVSVKAERGLKALASGIYPQYNDINTALMAAKTGEWVNSRSGKRLPLEPTLMTMVARGAFGARSEEELAYYDLNRSLYHTKENAADIVNGNRKHLIKQLNLFHEGKIDKEFLQEQLDLLMAWHEDWPEHMLHEIFVQSLITEEQDGKSFVSILADNAEFASRDIAALIEETTLPPEEKAKVREFLDEIYEQNVEGGNEFMNELLPEAPIWRN